jgi:hypothetical protein
MGWIINYNCGKNLSLAFFCSNRDVMRWVINYNWKKKLSLASCRSNRDVIREIMNYNSEKNLSFAFWPFIHESPNFFFLLFSKWYDTATASFIFEVELGNSWESKFLYRFSLISRFPYPQRSDRRREELSYRSYCCRELINQVINGFYTMQNIHCIRISGKVIVSISHSLFSFQSFHLYL